jgi:REP element-mobilizing transposase RayT
MKNPAGDRKVLHIYQNTPEGSLLFYTVSDFLVYFTVFCVSARKHRVTVLGTCPMFDHLHGLFEEESRKSVSGFIGDYTRQYSTLFNQTIAHSGAVFNPGFGCAVKTGDKSIRTACAYLYNNPGEKGLCKRAQDYRWTFLAYAVSDHPFSEKIILSKASRPLRRALKEVDCFRKQDKPLTYVILERLFRDLENKEKNQLTDYIISKYNCIDYDRLISYYGSYDKMCLAFASNQGSEYDIDEVFERGGHKVYTAISSTLLKEFGLKNVKHIFHMSPANQEDLARQLFYETSAQDWQIRKYFRWKK